MAQAPVKHDHDEPHAPKTVVESGPLVMPVGQAAPGKPTPTIGVKGEPIEDGERDPDTIAEEQRRRSAEYEASVGKDAPPAQIQAAASHSDNHKATKK